MNIPSPRQAQAFLGPLLGRSLTFVVSGRDANIRLGRFLMKCFTILNRRVVVVDTSAFYGQNAVALASGSSLVQLKNIQLFLPLNNLSDVLPFVVSPESEILVVDDLNAVYNSISAGLGRSGIRTLFTAMRLISYSARNNHFAVISTLYERDSASGARHGIRSLLAINQQVMVEESSSSITFKCPATRLWSRDSFTVDA